MGHIDDTKARLLGRGAKLKRARREYKTEVIVGVHIKCDMDIYIEPNLHLYFARRPSIEDITNSLFHYLLTVRQLHERTKVFCDSAIQIYDDTYEMQVRVVNKTEVTIVTLPITAVVRDTFININSPQ